MKWVYRHKKTGETISSPCIDSRYWSEDWECVDSPGIKIRMLQNSENFHCQPDQPFIENKLGPPKDMSELKPFPKITYELPEGTLGEVKQWWIDKTDDGFHVCISVEKETKIHWTDQTALSMQPEHWWIEKFTLLNALDSLAAGLEHAQHVLSEHDASLGRTTRKNKSWAETLESDIRNIEKSIKDLKTIEASHTTHYP